LAIERCLRIGDICLNSKNNQYLIIGYNNM